jgi:hypothetical protein
MIQKPEVSVLQEQKDSEGSAFEIWGRREPIGAIRSISKYEEG